MPDSRGAAVYGRARAIQERFEAANEEMYEAIRPRSMRGSRCAGAASVGAGAGSHDPEGYDYLDELVAGVFEFEDPGAAIVQATAEMVCYQPTPARHIFDLLNRIALTERDVLIDLGSGLGHVPLVTCLCTNARGIGIELEPVYVQSAQRSAERLNLKRVRFIQQDARAADLAEGTVFYLYTPCKGRMLRTVLDVLRREGVQRDLRVCTFGPCTRTVADGDWLRAVGSPPADGISIFRSCDYRC